MAGMRFSENLHPTHSHSWRPQLENPGHTNSHILILWPSALLYHFISPAYTHTHILVHKGGWLHSCSVSEDGFQSSHFIRIWRSICSNVWGTIAAKNERRREKKTRIRKKDSRKGEWGRYSREEVIATELTHIESNGSWGLWKISQHPHPPFSPSYDASIYSLQ